MNIKSPLSCPFRATQNTVPGGSDVPPSVTPFLACAASQSSCAACLIALFACFNVTFTSKTDKTAFLVPEGEPKSTIKSDEKRPRQMKLVGFGPLELIRVGFAVFLWLFSGFSLRRRVPPALHSPNAPHVEGPSGGLFGWWTSKSWDFLEILEIPEIVKFQNL